MLQLESPTLVRHGQPDDERAQHPLASGRVLVHREVPPDRIKDDVRERRIKRLVRRQLTRDDVEYPCPTRIKTLDRDPVAPDDAHRVPHMPVRSRLLVVTERRGLGPLGQEPYEAVLPSGLRERDLLTRRQSQR